MTSLKEQLAAEKEAALSYENMLSKLKTSLSRPPRMVDQACSFFSMMKMIAKPNLCVIF